MEERGEMSNPVFKCLLLNTPKWRKWTLGKSRVLEGVNQIHLNTLHMNSHTSQNQRNFDVTSFHWF